MATQKDLLAAGFTKINKNSFEITKDVTYYRGDNKVTQPVKFFVTFDTWGLREEGWCINIYREGYRDTEERHHHESYGHGDFRRRDCIDCALHFATEVIDKTKW